MRKWRTLAVRTAFLSLLLLLCSFAGLSTAQAQTTPSTTTGTPQLNLWGG
jgi:hypothetical protein